MGRMMVWLEGEKGQFSERKSLEGVMSVIPEFGFQLKAFERLARRRLLTRGDLSFVKAILAAERRKVRRVITN